MARETKVGLVAGLAFIICFAVILANRGQHRPGSPARPRYTPSRATVPPDAVGGARVANARPSTARRFTRSEHASAHTSANGQRKSPPRVDRANVGGLGAGAPERSPTQAGHTAVTQLPDAVPAPEGSGTTNGATLISTTMDAGTRLRVLERRLDQLAAGVANDGLATNVRIADRTTLPAPKKSSPPGGKSGTSRFARYAVKSGDTLWRIAAEHYGSGSPRFIDAIFDANRSVLSNPDVLRVGVELMIPSISGEQEVLSTRSQPKVDTKTVRPSPMQKPPTGAPHRWYQIKKDDRYVSIAREQLGDSRRWPEIYELNKDKFPDPGRIRAGVRIKLPARRLASSTEQRP